MNTVLMVKIGKLRELNKLKVELNRKVKIANNKILLFRN